MGQSSMAVQVAPLPHMHQQGPIHGIDGGRRTQGPARMPQSSRNGAVNLSPPASPSSSTQGSPNSHETQASDATQFGKNDDRYETFKDAHNHLAGSSATEHTDQTVLGDSEQSVRMSAGSTDGVGVANGAVHPEASGATKHMPAPATREPRPPSPHVTVIPEDAEHHTKESMHQNGTARAPATPDGPSQHKTVVTPDNGSEIDPEGRAPYPGELPGPLLQQGPNITDRIALPDEDAQRLESGIKSKGPSNQTSASRAAVAAAELNDDVLVGTRVTEGHENFVTAYNMLTGIRVAVSRCTAKVNRPLSAADFSATDEISFDLSGAGYNPSSKYMFRFKDYAPWVFRHLRDAFRLDPADYLMSLTAKYIVSELGSPGKSGSFFYYSRDYRFIIKTIRHSEHKLLRRILARYYSHVTKHPDTLISQFYGLHRVRLPFGRKIHFVVMNNVFPALYEIHERYDLKGSLLGREYQPNMTKPIVVYKDLDWLRRHKRVILGPEKRVRLVKQLEIDAKFLEQVNVMDYSLLVGVHDMSKGNTALNTLLRLKEFGPQGEKASKKEARQATEAAHGHNSVFLPSRTVQHEFSELQMLLQKANPEQLKEFDFADEYRSEFYFYRDHGGFQSSDDQNQDLDVIYYVGIIDFLTGYTFRKSVETFCKSLVHDRRELSAVPAQEYGERFLKFLRGCIGPEIKSKPTPRTTDRSSHAEQAESSPTAGAKDGRVVRPHPTSLVFNQSRGALQQQEQPHSPLQQDQSPTQPPQSQLQQQQGSMSTNALAANGYADHPVAKSLETVGDVSTGSVSAPDSDLHTPQKTPSTRARMSEHDYSASSLEPSTPGVAVTTDRSPSVTSRRSSPISTRGRRPSAAVYGPSASG